MISAENRAWLKGLPYQEMLTEINVLLCHGSPVRLEEFEYIFAPEQARECLPKGLSRSISCPARPSTCRSVSRGVENLMRLWGQMAWGRRVPTSSPCS